MSFSRTLKERSGDVWEAGYNHPFVQGLGRGDLPMEAFQFYLIQDYKYLLDYTRVFALGAAKADTESLMAHFTYAQNKIINGEMDLHRSYMAEFGITTGELAHIRQSLSNRAYTNNMLAVAHAGGPAEILATVFPCGWTYHDYATRLLQDFGVVEGNPYQSWLDTYAGDDFYDSFGWFYGELDRLCKDMSETQLEVIADIFRSSVEFEYLFWDMGWNRSMGIE